MDRFLEAEYNQFIIVGGIVLVFIILYIGYKHYMKQQYIENVPNKLNGSIPRSIAHSPMNQQKSILIFIPSITFQGERKGYKYGKGDKGLGYYLDKK